MVNIDTLITGVSAANKSDLKQIKKELNKIFSILDEKR